MSLLYVARHANELQQRKQTLTTASAVAAVAASKPVTDREREIAFDRRWRFKACNTLDALATAQAEARVALARMPDHSVADCVRWRAMFQPSPIMVRTNPPAYPDVALFRFSIDAFNMLLYSVRRARAGEVSAAVAECAFDFLRKNTPALEFLTVGTIRDDGHEVLVYTADLTETPRTASQGNILTLVDRTGELARLRRICRDIRPNHTAVVRILPHTHIRPLEWAGIVDGPALSFFHVHLFPTATYTPGPRDLPL